MPAWRTQAQRSSNSDPESNIESNDFHITAETVTNEKVPESVVREAENAAVPNEEAQRGVQGAEAITLTWTKKSLGAAYTL
jgi:hypothetical protein